MEGCIVASILVVNTSTHSMSKYIFTSTSPMHFLNSKILIPKFSSMLHTAVGGQNMGGKTIEKLGEKITHTLHP